jgi:acyl-CoA dehydrogenase
MLPFSHVVWSSLWLGIATEAVNRARTFVRGAARKTPGVTPPGALRLAEAMNTLTVMRANVQDAVREYENFASDPESLSSLGFAIRMNNLKIGTTELAVQVVGQALGVVGIMGYKEDSKMSVARHLRDVHGGALMVSNDRIYGTNAQLLCVYKDD